MTAREHCPHRFIVISPAKDESLFIERTIASMLSQTITPIKWVIVDDGSRDQTLQIVERYAKQHDWIVPVTIQRDAERRPGSAEILAFYAGYEHVRDIECDFVVKLDTDLEFPSDYFERMFAEFDLDRSLGIASGIYLEEHNGTWIPIKMPAYHAAGASKIVRRSCLVDIGGFPLFPGWDTADEIKAQTRGWRTRHFTEIQFLHLRPEGLAIGLLRTSASHGRMYYACGGGPIFLLFKMIRRMMFGKPFLAGGVALLYGYLQASVSRKPRLVSEAEARSYRKLLNRQVTGSLNKLLPFLGVN